MLDLVLEGNTSVTTRLTQDGARLQAGREKAQPHQRPRPESAELKAVTMLQLYFNITDMYSVQVYIPLVVGPRRFQIELVSVLSASFSLYYSADVMMCAECTTPVQQG